MKKKVYHITIKATGEHDYYNSLTALFKERKDLGVSIFTLQRFDLSSPYENEICIIRLSYSKSTSDVGQGYT